MYSRPSRLSMAPQLGTPTGRPNPRKHQRSLGDDRPADVDAEDDDHDRHDVGQDVADECSPPRGADHLDRLEVRILLDVDDGASNESRATDATGYSQDHDKLWQTPPHDGPPRNRPTSAPPGLPRRQRNLRCRRSGWRPRRSKRSPPGRRSTRAGPRERGGSTSLVPSGRYRGDNGRMSRSAGLPGQHAACPDPGVAPAEVLTWPGFAAKLCRSREHDARAIS